MQEMFRTVSVFHSFFSSVVKQTVYTRKKKVSCCNNTNTYPLISVVIAVSGVMTTAHPFLCADYQRRVYRVICGHL